MIKYFANVFATIYIDKQLLSMRGNGSDSGGFMNDGAAVVDTDVSVLLIANCSRYHRYQRHSYHLITGSEFDCLTLLFLII